MPYPFDRDSRRGRPQNPERDPLIGTTLDDRFLIEDRIASGGFGAIYRARTAGGAMIALKILHPRLASDPTMVARFRREGAILTKLHDPHTVTTLRVGEAAGGMLYIAMELLSGETLQDHLQRAGALPWQAAVAIARAVCSSLAEAHTLGVVHRDLKPANILVDSRGGAVRGVKVIDFGIVKIARGSAIDDGDDLTSAGHMIGTYDYMSPEQLLGAECSAASDLYSLGAVTYEMLTGRRPYPKVASPASMMTAIVTQTPMPPSMLAAIPPELDRIVMRCLERDPAARLAGASELAHELDRLMAARAAPHDEVTLMRPIWHTMRDDRAWLEPSADAIADVIAADDAADEPLADSESGDPSPLAPWTLPMAGAFGESSVTEPPPTATRTARGSRPRHGTLPGVAVAPGNAPSQAERATPASEPTPPSRAASGRNPPEYAASEPTPPSLADSRRMPREYAPSERMPPGYAPSERIPPEPVPLDAERTSPRRASSERLAHTRGSPERVPPGWRSVRAERTTPTRVRTAPMRVPPPPPVPMPPLKPWLLPPLIPPERTGMSTPPPRQAPELWWIAVAILVVAAATVAALLLFAGEP